MFNNGDLVYIDHGSFFLTLNSRECVRVNKNESMICIITNVDLQRIEILHPTLGFIYSSCMYLNRFSLADSCRRF